MQKGPPRSGFFGLEQPDSPSFENSDRYNPDFDTDITKAGYIEPYTTIHEFIPFYSGSICITDSPRAKQEENNEDRKNEKKREDATTVGVIVNEDDTFVYDWQMTNLELKLSDWNHEVNVSEFECSLPSLNVYTANPFEPSNDYLDIDPMFLEPEQSSNSIDKKALKKQRCILKTIKKSLKSIENIIEQQKIERSKIVEKAQDMETEDQKQSLNMLLKEYDLRIGAAQYKISTIKQAAASLLRENKY